MNWNRYWITLPGVLGLSAVLFGLHTGTLAFTLSLALASLGLFLAGHAVSCLLPGLFTAAPFFNSLSLKIFIGQWVLVSLVKILSPLLVFAVSGLSYSFPLFFVAWALVFVLCALCFRSFQVSTAAPWLPWALYSLFVLGIGSQFAKDLGPIGIDTHQHLSYVQQILEAGYLPLVGRGSAFIDNYVKTAHVLCAVWSSLGLYPFSGAFLKAMPFLQGTLIIFVFLEGVFGLWMSQGKKPVVGYTFLLLSLLLIFGFGVQSWNFTWPDPDLNGTARMISISLIIFPVATACLGLIGEDRKILQTGVVLVPWFLGLGLTCNPASLSLFGTFSLAIPLILAFTFRKSLHKGFDHKFLTVSLGLSAAAGCFVLITDPYIINMLADHSASLTNALDSFGIVSRKLAIERGLFDPTAISDVGRQVGSSISDLLTKYLSDISLQSGVILHHISTKPFLPGLEKSSAQSRNLAMLIIGVLCLYALTRGFRSNRPVLRKPITFLLLVVFFIFVQRVMGLLILGSVSTLGLEIELLGIYTFVYPAFFTLPLLLIAMTWILAEAMDAAPLANRLNGRFPIAGLLLPFMVLVFDYKIPFGPNTWTNGPLREADIRSFWAMEEQIPKGSRVLVPATYMSSQNQHWILPQKDVSSLLPYGRRSYIFNFYLGESLQWNHFDLEKFCSSERDARKLLVDRKIHWIAFAKDKPLPKAVVDICQPTVQAVLMETTLWKPKELVSRNLLFLSAPDTF